jgi:AcrR family transcriptional regulator
MQAQRVPQQLRAKRTRKNLLDAARTVFTRCGYAGASLDDIVAEAGCSKGAYYFHFASKEEALLALVDAWAADRSHRLQLATGRYATPEVALAALLGAALTVDGNGWQAQLIVEFWAQSERSEDVRRRLEAADLARRDTLIEAFRAFRETGRVALSLAPEEAAHVVLTVGRGLTAEAAANDGHANAEMVARSLLTLMVGGAPLRKAV